MAYSPGNYACNFSFASGGASFFQGAGIDLLPGSPFLTELNSRPLPNPLDIQVIAGTVSPWSEDRIPTFTHALNKTVFDRICSL